MEDLKTELTNFIADEPRDPADPTPTPEVSKIETDKSIVERINKKIITEDGRQLLI